MSSLSKLTIGARSITGKLLVMLAIFLALPTILYQQFRQADQEKQELLAHAIQQQGRIAAAALRERLENFTAGEPSVVRDELVELAGNDLRVRLLLRAPDDLGSRDFYYVAMHPDVSREFLERDRNNLLEAGVLETISGSCEAESQVAMRYRNPAGEEEVLTSITPVNTAGGCWAVILSQDQTTFLGAALGRSHWETPEVRLAIISYVIMALAALTVLIAVRNSLRQFAQRARMLRHRRPGLHGSFVESNTVPEMHGVAEEFDRLVDLLHNTAEAVRISAQEKAHALKGPLATIAQSIEPLRRRVAVDDERGRAACERIDQSIERMSALITAAQRVNQVIAESIEPPREPVALSSLVAEVAKNHARIFEADETVVFECNITSGISVSGNHDMIASILDNLLENARSFARKGDTVTLTLESRDDETAELRVEDTGPGAPPDVLPRIFDRYFSGRTHDEEAGQPDSEQHFGIGLWIVKRNAEALGGDVMAENREDGGFRVGVTLPLAARAAA